MNPVYSSEAKKIFATLKKKKVNTKKFIPVICPPYLFLNELKSSYRGKNFLFGAQDAFFEDASENNGESTGQISNEMLKGAGAEYVIIGHSEKRKWGDTDEIVSQKIRKTIDSGMKSILCVGENERDESGKYLKFVESQLVEALTKIEKNKISNLVIAYEPIWAIGKGKEAITAHELHQMVLYIKKVLVFIYGMKIGLEIPIIYGGSVDADNAKEILDDGEVNGLLVGRASTNPHIFGEIICRK